MKKLFAATFAIAALAVAPALAADLPARPVYKGAAPAVVAAGYNWSGFYVGIHGGVGWGSKDWTETTLAAPRPEGSFDVRGWLLGAQIGYNFQTGPVVFGIEAQGSWANITGDRTSAAFAGQTIRTEVDSLGTVAGRLGYAVGNALLYGKGGLAWAHDKNSVLGAATAAWSDTRWGWMLGGGLELGITPNWSIKGEYNYMDFGTRRYTGLACAGACVGPFSEDITQRLSVVKVGLNYRFGGGPVVARY
jgi:outer membrane immunogenic protein